MATMDEIDLYSWCGDAGTPAELADEIESVECVTLRLPNVEPVEIVTITMTAANRAVLVAALRGVSACN